MSFSAVGSAIKPTLSGSGSTRTFSLTPATVGDFILLEVVSESTTIKCTTAASSNATWSVLTGPTQTHSNSYWATIFIGKVTAASAATVTLTFSGTASTIRLLGQEFSSTVGASSVTLDVVTDIPSGSTATWPSLTPAHGTEMYFGFATFSSTVSFGSTTGYVYNSDSSGNGMAYNLAVTAASDPVWGSSGSWNGLVVLVYEASGGTAHTQTASLTVTPSFSVTASRTAAAHTATASLSVTPTISATPSRAGVARTRTASLTVTPSFSAAGTGGGAALTRTAHLTVTPSFSVSRSRGAVARTDTASLTVTPSFSAAGTASAAGPTASASLRVIPSFSAGRSRGGAAHTATVSLVVAPFLSASPVSAGERNSAAGITITPFIHAAPWHTSPPPAPPAPSPVDNGIVIDALSRDLLPQQPIEWSLIDINTLNFNQAGSFSMQVPATDANWSLITFDANGEFIPFAIYVDWHGVFQVPLLVEAYEQDLSVDSSSGTVTESLTLTGSDFLSLLAARVAYPDGTLPWTKQTGKPVTYTGSAETVIKNIVVANTVSAGDAARRIPNFVVAPDQARGDTVTYTVTPPVPALTTTGQPAANLGASLMDVIRTIANQSLIGVTITLANNELVFDTFIPRDLSESAVFAASLGNLRSDSISAGIPTADVALVESATTENITASQPWTCPPGITSVDVECWGAGGGGAGGYKEIRAGGGGGGGEFSRQTIAVTPGKTYTVTVGTGGHGGNSADAGADGGNSSFTGDSATVTGHGGGGAESASTNAIGGGGNGGRGSGAPVHRNGGDGGAGTRLGPPDKSGSKDGGNGGGGASSAGLSANGNFGGKDTKQGGGPGAKAPAGGGAGGDGGSQGGGTGSVGSAGSGPGGGGGGGGTGPNGGGGGDGADGQVNITYLSAGASAFIEADADGYAPADPWRRTESFSDQTSTASATDIATAISNILTNGVAQQALTVTAIDTPALRFGNPAAPAQGYGLGDTVTVQVRDGVIYTDMVTAVELAASTTGYISLPQALSNTAVFQQTVASPSSATASGYVEFVTATLGTLAQPGGNTTATGMLAGTTGGAPATLAGQAPPGAIGGALLGPGAALGNIGPGGITPDYIQSLTASLIGNIGVLNGNPYLTGGDPAGWELEGTGSGATLDVVVDQPPGSPFKYALQLVLPATGAQSCGGGAAGSINAFAIQPDTQYLVSGLFRTTGDSITLGFNWWNATTFESSSDNAFTVSADTWVPLTFVATSPPAGSDTGSPFFTTTDGDTVWGEAIVCLPQVPGALIEAGTVTATQIAAGSITAGLLVAGIVVAGIVNGTTIQGSNLVADGNNGGVFVYGGTPASGNLDVSVTPTSGTDAEGNPYDAGVHVQNGGKITTSESGVQIVEQIFAGNPIKQWFSGYANESGPAGIFTNLFNIGLAAEYISWIMNGPVVTGSLDQVWMRLQSAAQDASAPASGSLGYTSTAGATANRLTWDENGVKVYNGIDSNTYVTERLTVVLAGSQVVSNTGTAVAVNDMGSLDLGDGWYRIHGNITYQCNHSAGNPAFLLAGPTIIHINAKTMFQQLLNSGSSAAPITYYSNSAWPNNNGPTMSSGAVYSWEFDVTVRCDAGGFAVETGTSNSADNFTIQAGSWVEILPIGV